MDNPPFFPPQRYDDPAAALAQVVAIYEAGVAWLREAVQRFVAGQDPSHRVHAFYPFVRVRTETVARADSRLSYGFVAGPGTYETTLTRPDLFGRYYLEQFRLLLANHQVPIEVGTGKTPI
ncbi:MAG: AMP nucleosidase, partial [Burkholderiaceae bacterium]|nr:AMP nucleosidase [Burkholderiaceae bacterium]